MPWVLRSLRWWIGHLLVVALCVAFVNLGFWQLRRAEERRLENQVFSARFNSDPLPIADLVTAAASDLDSLHLRRAVAEGELHPEAEALVRSQVNNGVAGFHIITPLVLSGGEAILVNRGWVPLELDSVPSPVAPPAGPTQVEGWLRLSQSTVSSPSPGTDQPRIVSSVDIDQLQTQMPWRLLGVYLVDEGGGPNHLDIDGGVVGSLPVTVPPPDLTDEGPHLLYAVQWWAFTVIGVVGYGLLLRRAVMSQAPGSVE